MSDQDCFVSISELMLHWSTEGYASMGAPKDPVGYQVGIPKLGFTFPYLLRAVLAFSAFHLAHLNSGLLKSTYHLRALHHQQLALQGLRAALQQPSSENCHALFLTAVLLIVTKFAGFSGCADHGGNACGDPIQRLAEVFSVCSGAMTIVNIYNRELSQGPLGFIFMDEEAGAGDGSLLCTLLDQLMALRTTILEDHCEDQSILLTSLDTMAARIRDVMDQPPSQPEAFLLFAVPMFTPPSFVNLITRKHHAALAILAHYCVLIKMTEESLWCCQGWWISLVMHIETELEGSPWAGTLEWPLKVTSYSRSTPSRQ